MPVPKVVDVKPLGGLRIWLRFADGCAGEIDLSVGDFLNDQPELRELLRDRDFFEQIAWLEDSYLGWSPDHWVEATELYACLNGRSMQEQLALLDDERDPSERPQRLLQAEPLEGYRLRLTYSDGVRGVADMSQLVGSGVFELWNDPVEFQRARVSKWGDFVYWSEQVDSCALHLYEQITGSDAHGFGIAETAALGAE